MRPEKLMHTQRDQKETKYDDLPLRLGAENLDAMAESLCELLSIGADI